MIKAFNKKFSNKNELLSYVKLNKEDILAEKKASIASEKYAVFTTSFQKSEQNKEYGEPMLHSIVNTAYYFDSHMDVHLPGNWDKSVEEQKNKIYHVTDHDFVTTKIVGLPKHIIFEINKVKWSDLGVDFQGETEVLEAYTEITKITPKTLLNLLDEGAELQSSPSMRYIKYRLAVNDPEDEDFADEYAEYIKHINYIANKDDVEKYGFFWAVYESALHREFSSVIAGSNPITPLRYQPSNDTVQSEPSADTRKNLIINPNIY